MILIDDDQGSRLVQCAANDCASNEAIRVGNKVFALFCAGETKADGNWWEIGKDNPLARRGECVINVSAMNCDEGDT